MNKADEIMRHEEIASICRQMIVENYNLKSEDQISIDPWDKVVREFAQLCREGNADSNTIQRAFRPILEAVR